LKEEEDIIQSDIMLSVRMKHVKFGTYW